MTSDTSSANVPPGTAADKTTAVVSVRLPKRPHDFEKLIRRAAVEVDASRSGFIADAAIARAREVLKLKRDEDLAAYLAAA